MMHNMSNFEENVDEDAEEIKSDHVHDDDC